MSDHKHDPDDDACIAEAEEVEPGTSEDAAIWRGTCKVTGEQVTYLAYNDGKTKVIS